MDKREKMALEILCSLIQASHTEIGKNCLETVFQANEGLIDGREILINSSVIYADLLLEKLEKVR